MFKNNTLSTPEIKSAQSKYLIAQNNLKTLEKSKAQITEKLKDLIERETQEQKLCTAAHEAAVQAYSDAIATGNTETERASDTKLQELMGESEKQKGKRLARAAAIVKLRDGIFNLDNEIERSKQLSASAHKAVLVAIRYKRAEIFNSIAADLVEAAKKCNEVGRELGLYNLMDGIKIPLQCTHSQDRGGWIGGHSVSIKVKDPTIDDLLAN